MHGCGVIISDPKDKKDGQIDTNEDRNAAAFGIDSKQEKKNLIFFPFGTFGRDTIYTLFTNFVLLYVLFTHRLTAAQLMAMLGMNAYYVIMMISIINTVEYNEYRNGTRDEAIVASIRPFFTKFGSALCILLTSGSYLLLGVTDYTNEISSYEQAANMGSITEAEKLSSIDSVIASVTALQSHGLLLVMVLVPAVMMLLTYLLYKKHYILDEDEYDRIVAELAKRNK